MKLAGREAIRYFARPDPDRAGLLIHGADAMRVSLRRQEVLAALLGPAAEAEMRLTRLPGAGLRADPAQVMDAMRARGFFPGPRAVLVEDAGDPAAPAIVAALSEWQSGDAQLLVTARALGRGAALRKAFEAHPNAVAIAIYDDPMGREEVEATLSRAGLTEVAPEAMQDLMALAQSLDPGDVQQTIEKLALYRYGEEGPVTPADLAACAPATIEADLDEVLHATAEALPDKIAPLMRRLGGQGTAPVTLCISATRHFRALHAAAVHPKGPAAGLAGLRPPVFGPRRDRMQRQAQRWGVPRLERALSLLIATDLQLRASTPVPQAALMERTLTRLAMLGAQGR